MSAEGAVAAPGHDAGGAAATQEREGFLDTVRAIAIVRVIAWHAFGAAAITYFVAAIPAMFFVTGSLLAKSFRRRSAPVVLADRFRRLLVPLWAFALVAWLAMAVAAWNTGDHLSPRDALTWLFPLSDPVGTDWEGGWLSSHLWYLRALVWLLLASPLLLRAFRASRLLTLLVLTGTVFALDVLSRRPGALPLPDDAVWWVGDFALYGVFLVLGFAHRDGALRAVRRRGWLAVAVVAGAGAVAWRLTMPVPLGVVNNSHPMHLFVGLAWLAAALAVQQPLAHLAQAPVTGRLVRAIGRRSLTIYLWHTAAIILAVNLLDERGVEHPLARPVALVLLTALGTVVAARLFGPIEDLAAGRRRTTPAQTTVNPAPRRIAVALLAVTAAVVIDVAPPPGGRSATTSASPRRPPTPSQQPPKPVFAPEASEPVAVDLTPAEQNTFVAGLGEVLASWVEQVGVAGAIAGVAIGPDRVWTGATGIRPETGLPATPADRIDLASVTKLFTATLVYRYVDAGLIDLSAPLPTLSALPDFPYDVGITVGQLVGHTTGIPSYHETATYAGDPTRFVDPASAITISLGEGFVAVPGEELVYSSTNYLVLGLLLEELSGQPYDRLLADQLLRPLGLDATVHLPSEPTSPRGGTAGMETTLKDLLTAGIAILRDGGGLSDSSFETLTAIDPVTGAGKGAFGYCPCHVDAEGVPRFFALGHHGSTTVLAYIPTLDMTIALDLTESLWEGDRIGGVPTLFEMIEARAANG